MRQIILLCVLAISFYGQLAQSLENQDIHEILHTDTYNIEIIFEEISESILNFFYLDEITKSYRQIQQL